MKQVQQLKLNVTNINSFLKESNKKYIGLKKSNNALSDQEIKKSRIKEKESKVEKISPKTSPLSSVTEIASPSMGLFDKAINLGSILLTGVLINALPAIKEKVDKFKEENKEVISAVTDTLTDIKNFATSLFDSMTGPESEEGAFDDIAKFNPNTGELTGGALKTVKDTFDGFADMLNSIEKALGGKGTIGNALKTDAPPPPSREELVRQTERGSGMASFREDNAENNALQKSVKRQSSASSAPDLKTAIRRAESGNDYGATFRAYLDGFSRRSEDITNMSINQVVQYQKDYIAHQRKLGIPETKRSAAVGAYQMLFPELAASKTGVPLTAKFNKENQDRMADYYLNVAGYQQFINGKITAAQFNDRLAGQFASLKTTSGGGVYDSDGINRAYEDLLDLIKKLKPQPKITPNTGSKDKQISTLNTNIDGDGSTTIILARQPVLT